MSESVASIPGFKPILTTVGVTYVLLAIMNLARGAGAILEPFALPPTVITSPVFLDFYHWLFVHMTTIGVLIALLGWLVTDAPKQKWVAWTLLILEVHYTYLDLRTSAWGSGLYRDPRSLVLVAFDMVITLAFGYLCLRSVLRSLSRPNRTIRA